MLITRIPDQFFSCEYCDPFGSWLVRHFYSLLTQIILIGYYKQGKKIGQAVVVHICDTRFETGECSIKANLGYI